MLDEQSLTQAVRQATAAVFSTMLNLQVDALENRHVSDPPPDTGVMAVLGFTGDWVGSGVFYCQEKMACRLSSAMLMTEITQITDEVLDGVGEVANMVMGNVKDGLSTVIGPLAMSVPTVVFGRNFQTRPPLRHSWFIAPFQVGEDRFEVRLCLSPKDNK